MKLVAAIVASLLVADSVAAQSSGIERVRNVLTSYAGAVARGDFSAVDTLFAEGPGVHIIEGAGVNHGWAEYRDDHLKPEFESFQSLSYEFSSIEPVVHGDFAYAAFRIATLIELPDRRVDLEGRGTAVLRSEGGRWVIAHLHTSSRPRRGS